MRIKRIKEDRLIFDDNSYITYDTYTHYPYYVLAHNYLDFYVHSEIFFYDFQTPLKFEKAKDGFYFGDDNQTVFIPYFSEQNLKENEDTYDNTIKIIYNDGKGNETIVLENVECKIINDEY